MHQGRTVGTLVAEIVENARTRQDFVVPTSVLRMDDDLRLGLANAITAQAHTTADYGRSVELEAIGGKLMAMQTRDFSRLTSVAE